MSEPGAGAGVLLDVVPDAELFNGSLIMSTVRSGSAYRAENRDSSTRSARRERPLSCMHSLQNGQSHKKRGRQTDRQLSLSLSVNTTTHIRSETNPAPPPRADWLSPSRLLRSHRSIVSFLLHSDWFTRCHVMSPQQQPNSGFNNSQETI